VNLSRERAGQKSLFESEKSTCVIGAIIITLGVPGADKYRSPLQLCKLQLCIAAPRHAALRSVRVRARLFLRI